ncbi:hypothetical protein E2K80_13180 [Rhodophyticola sp. CCM32]|uniref:amidohydrolase family protein n=1 Tax=Rhodophyticola sp. CCM32 TaxID=2916397 RepID=UPI00107F1F2E|nr:amidohydrolase family protein [Rhodophyticola sp. CCM32]QBY01559.1 hypothetical protein E2K80_13180 [Rhodophyticola sp. CCM32]
MSDIRITNCHVHLFGARHVPDNYPFAWLRPLKSVPFLIRCISGFLRLIGQHPTAEKVDRLYQFQVEAQQASQRAVLERLQRHYPSNTRFVVLPMDLSQIGYGTPAISLRAQHDELAALAQNPDLGGAVLPFAKIDPRADPEGRELWRALECRDRFGKRIFRGVKIYPRLGYAPDDPRLMAHVYPRMQAESLPLMTHCSRGGVQGRDVSDHRANRYTEPDAYREVLRQFRDLRVCLAHFGGQKDWAAYGNPDRVAPDAYEVVNNWQVGIREMITSGDYPNLWTDISYTLFQFEENIAFLRLFLTGEGEKAERLRSRVLFGSDFYMTRQEKLPEKAVCFRLRNALGEDLFRKIADENPVIWLGET